MFLYGNQIVNDYNFTNLFNHLISIKAVRGRDYVYYGDSKIILKTTNKIINDSRCYRYQRVSNKTFIGRTIDITNRIITDYVYDVSIINSPDPDIGPFTFGWTYDYNYTSVSTYIMKLISYIPRYLRKDKEYVATYICSKIDSCNDPVKGIIEGRWESTFTGGKEPSAWKSSSEVFRERIINNGPVKYGQCWVLADILTGIYNFLGLKARTVRVQPCIMDLHDKRGIDFSESSDGMRLKGGASFKGAMALRGAMVDPRSFICCKVNEEIIYQSALKIKGPVHDIESKTKVDLKDLYDLDYFFHDYINESWNYHVWTEVYIGDWVVFDPSPLHSVDATKFKPYQRKNGLRFFGPVPLKDIKENHNVTESIDFDYLFSCVNGQSRTWRPFIMKTGGSMLYLQDVVYDVPVITQRTKNGSLLDVTSRYRSSYEDNHINNPVYLTKGKLDGKFFVYINPHQDSDYVVQVCIIDRNNLLYIHRERSTKITYESLLFLKNDQLKKYRRVASHVTLAIYDIKRNKFWAQCIQT